MKPDYVERSTMRAAGTNYVYPPHYRVRELMDEFGAWLRSDAATSLHPVAMASEAHFRFVSIHPFRDGNGRAARLLMNLCLLRAGYPITVIFNARRADYIESLVYGQSHNGNSAQLTALVAQACRESLVETLRGDGGQKSRARRGVLSRDDGAVS